MFFPKRLLTICTSNLNLTTEAQNIEVSEFVTLKMLCYKSVADGSDILGGPSGECLVLAKINSA